MRTIRIADYYFTGFLASTLLPIFFLGVFFMLLQIRAWETEAIRAGRLVEEARRGEVEGHVLRTLNFLDYIGGAGIPMSTEELQALSLRRLKAVTFGSGGYIFIIRKDGTLLLTGAGTESLGSNLLNSSDPDAVDIAKKSLEAASRPGGGGFIEYRWPKPGGREKEMKLSFVADYPKWGWIVGAGVYTDDLEVMRLKEVAGIRTSLVWNITALIILFGAALAVSVGMNRLYARRVRNDTDLLTRFMVEAGNETTRPLEGAFRFMEFRVLAERLDRTLVELEKSRLELQGALGEKEVLLREIHHRVKNNLQIIVSLLRLSGDEAGGAAESIFLDMEHRIRSMALLHELLYESDDIGAIPMDDYVERLLSHLKSGYETLFRDVALETDLEPLRMDINEALPCGLLVNEIVSNALKHAFPADFKGPKAIRVSLTRKEGTIRIVVSDNGRGIPGKKKAEDFSSVGVMLIGALSRQLKGGCLLDTEAGTRWTIEFPVREG